MLYNITTDLPPEIIFGLIVQKNKLNKCILFIFILQMLHWPGCVCM